jgi:uncharacterized protein YchJ
MCFCGGAKRFAECCKQAISELPNPHNRSDPIKEAMNRSDFSGAERLARAALAQYVIWIKRHTAPTMNVAKDLHSTFLSIDVLALEAHVNSFEESLEATGNVDSFLPHLRQLSRIVGIPKIAMRLTALATRWLVKSRRIEEAVLELDTLGDIEKVDDSLALIVAADLLDLSENQAINLLIKAASVATCDEERWLAQLAQARRLVKVGKPTDALPITESVILESRESRENKTTTLEAEVIRWRITKKQSDLVSAMAGMKQIQDARRRQQFAGIVIDEGLYAEAEQLLNEDLAANDPIAKLLIVDARIRAGNRDSARDLFLTVVAERIPQPLQLVYAVTAGLVALSCGDEGICQSAILLLEKELSAAGELKEYVNNLLLGLRANA